MTPLRDLVVVEYAGSVAGAYCAKLFADGGAKVTVVGERTLSPHHQMYLDVDKAHGAAEDVALSTVDVVIESSSPDPLVPLDLRNGQLVRVQISPFGQTGERSHWKSTDLTDYAISGHAYLYGDPEREPLRGPAHQPAVAAGIYGFVGAMAALLARDRVDGQGQTVDISHVQVMVALHQVTLLRWMMAGDVLCRLGNRYTGQGQPNGPFRCVDGWVSVAGVSTQQVESILAVTGLLRLLEHPDIASPMDFEAHPDLLHEPLTKWFSTQKVGDVIALFQAMRVPAAPLLAPAELLKDPQLAAREFFRPLASDPTIQIPGRPYTLSHEQQRGDRAWQPGPISQGPLAGLKVLDLARVWAGPLCARILRDLGAQVVWVEAPWNRGPQELPQSLIDTTHHFPNDQAGDRPWNRNAHFVKYSLGKQSLAIDLQTPAGQAAFKRLVPQFHVVLENFSTRVMPQFGLGEDALHELNPDLIYLTMPGYGRSGPAENWLAYGSTVDSHAGLSSVIGYRDQSPWKGGIAWPDPIAGLHATAAVLSTLWSGLTHGTGGLTIEGAQFESTVAAIGDRIVEAQISGTFVPDGNRQAGYLAQGVYPALGDDNWIALSAPDQTTLDHLLVVLDLGGLTAGDHDDFDSAVSEKTALLEAGDLAEQLQAVGVPAAKVTRAADLMADPHLLSRNGWESFEQPDIGTFTAPVTPIAMSRTMPERPRPAPTLGQHNDLILAAAGFSDDEIAALFANKTIVTKPPS